VKELERAVEVVKKVGAGYVKYVKYSYAPATGLYHLKIYLVKPMEFKALVEVVKELERHFSVKIFAPHRGAIRLDLQKRG